MRLLTEPSLLQQNAILVFRVYSPSGTTPVNVDSLNIK